MPEVDINQGQNESDLFREAVDDTQTLEQFENPKLQPAPLQEDKSAVAQLRDEQGRFQKAGQTEVPPTEPEGQPVPSFRLREESEARRRAEAELSELRARIAAYEVARQQSQPQQRPIDLFDNPAEYIKQVMAPYIQQMAQESQSRLEKQSVDNAQRTYGVEAVDQAYNAISMGVRSGDQTAAAVLNNALGSHDPYGVITRWYLDQQTLAQIGGDLNAYKKSVLDQAMRDPDYQRQVFNAMRGQATQQINRPVSTQQMSTFNAPNQSPLPPSLSDIGAAGGDILQEPLDENAMFRAAVTAKRRPTIPGR